MTFSLTSPSEILRSLLRSYDGKCKENVTLKLNFASSLLRLLHVDHVVQNRRTALSRAWYEWFSCKGKEWKIYCCELALSELQIWKFHVVVWQTTSKHCNKKRAASAARLCFFIDLWRGRWRRQILNLKLRIWLAACAKIIVLHALMNKSMPSSAKQQREITTFAVLMNTCAYNR